MTTAVTPASEQDTAFRQSLAHGSLGIALLHIERARQGDGSRQDVHRQLTGVGPLLDGDTAGLFLGAPAMTYVLHLAAAGSNQYVGALNALDRIVTTHTRRRLKAAHTRIDHGRPASFAEYDLLRGLTGLGALLLRRAPDGAEIQAVLEYLVRLAEPLPGPNGRPRPGWWVGHSPVNLGNPTPGGHANAGLAHGITGPLALLALAHLRGITVPGHQEAMIRICRWLDRIRVSDRRGTRWPRWITDTTASPVHSAAPSWCYGTPGLTRAQQLAALALGETDRKRMAERALLDCLADPLQLDQLTGRGLCHGTGGLMRVVQRVAQDTDEPAAFISFLPHLSERFLAAETPTEAGFLEGAAGAALTLQGIEADEAQVRDWDACLLLV
ncbi:lanthionine synthetase C family protein [Streptomyces sp. NBC_01622]|uniref:lanthionine synthetase C family protein n=1 Tax=unclassified Streptomyces TaxID=2593676 RepID=UPI002250E1B1|nr:lanthionine synthetase C family protein [Streptomyces sp. NBC_00183]MCX5286505.1 lanthionine synthetase C family protein [Streptomyces sp. NBC_00183]WTE43910.1 lanthionine synthetase C family protein [Streptomyces sp. NBC_01622]